MLETDGNLRLMFPFLSDDTVFGWVSLSTFWRHCSLHLQGEVTADLTLRFTVICHGDFICPNW